MQKRNVLVVGSGGREHALAWKLQESPLLEKLYVAPGNGGTLDYNIPIQTNDVKGLCEFAELHKCLTIVGPEAPLSQGLVDELEQKGLQVIGPTREQARLETSKAYAKRLMNEVGIPTADFEIFSDNEKAIDYAKSKEYKVVVKADGLASGKGVFVCSNKEEAETA